MTAIRQRRRRATVVALVVSLLALAGAAGLVIAGVSTLADSTAGREAPGADGFGVVQRLPFTSTALAGVIDEDGRLTSVVVLALEPDGTGGTIVGLAATADAESGTTGILAPLAAVLELEGPDAFRQAASGLTGLSFDVVEVVDTRRFAQLVTPLGDLDVVFPVPLHDASSGEEWAAGQVVLSTAAAARAVTASDPSIADWYLEPGRSAVWAGIARRVGAGIGSASPVASDEDLPVPRDLDEFLARLFAGPVEFRELTFRVLDAERVADELPAELADVFAPAPDAVVAHDRAEMVMVLGAVAPARLGAPLDAPSFRMVSPFSAAELEAAGVTDAELLRVALDRLLFAKVNIVSVANTRSGDVPDVTRIEVLDPSVIDAVIGTYEELWGAGEVVEAEAPIEGIDIVVTLGRPFLEEVGSQVAENVAGSGGDVADDEQADGEEG